MCEGAINFLRPWKQRNIWITNLLPKVALVQDFDKCEQAFTIVDYRLVVDNGQ